VESSIFIAKLPEEPYLPVSAAESFVNPITATFSMRDSNKYKYATQPYYIIIVNKIIDFVQLETIGMIPGFEMLISWVNVESAWTSKLMKENLMMDVTNRTEVIPFFVRFKVLDDLDVIQMDQYKNMIKLRLVWA